MADELNKPLSNNPSTQDIIRSITEKKELLQKAVALEVNQLNVLIQTEYSKSGKKAYADYIQGNFSAEGLMEFFSEITRLNTLINEKNHKLSEITKRYDEELNILLSAVNNPKPADKCPKCSYPVNLAQDAFCPNCGSNTAKPPAPAEPVYKCKSCNAPYKPGTDIFCSGCGAKLATESPSKSSCTRCNYPVNPKSDAFCPNCGLAVSN